MTRGRHVPVEHPLVMPPAAVRRILDMGATRLRLPVKCGTSFVNGVRAGSARWRDLRLDEAAAGDAALVVDGDAVTCRFEPETRLWVREAYHAEHPPEHYADRFRDRDGLYYRADHPVGYAGCVWREAETMPRAMSRIDLEVVRVRPARLLDAGADEVALHGFNGPTSVQDMLDAYHDQHGGRMATGPAANPWTWDLLVNVRAG